MLTKEIKQDLTLLQVLDERSFLNFQVRKILARDDNKYLRDAITSFQPMDEYSSEEE